MTYKPSPWVRPPTLYERVKVRRYLPDKPFPHSFPYSPEAWAEHKQRVDQLLDDLRDGKVRLLTAHISGPNYGGYSYGSEERPERVSAEYADPDEVLMVAEAANWDQVHLSGGWWADHGYKGWGETVPLHEARSLLELARRR